MPTPPPPSHWRSPVSGPSASDAATRCSGPRVPLPHPSVCSDSPIPSPPTSALYHHPDSTASRIIPGLLAPWRLARTLRSVILPTGHRPWTCLTKAAIWPLAGPPRPLIILLAQGSLFLFGLGSYSLRAQLACARPAESPVPSLVPMSISGQEARRRGTATPGGGLEGPDRR